MNIAVDTNYPDGKDYDRAARFDSKSADQMEAIVKQIADYNKMCRRTRAALEKFAPAADYFLMRWVDPFWGYRLADVLEVTEWAHNKGYIHSAIELVISITNPRTNTVDSGSEIFYCPTQYGLVAEAIIEVLQNNKLKTEKEVAATGNILSEYTIRRRTL